MIGRKKIVRWILNLCCFLSGVVNVMDCYGFIFLYLVVWVEMVDIVSMLIKFGWVFFDRFIVVFSDVSLDD